MGESKRDKRNMTDKVLTQFFQHNAFHNFTYAKITDDMGVRYRNLCDACIEIYNATPEENKIG